MIWAIPAVMAVAGAAMGKAKHDREVANEEADRKLAAETARYSPWTGMSPGSIRRAGSQFGSIMGGAQQGFSSGMGIGGMMGGGASGQQQALTPQQNQAFQNQTNYNSMYDDSGYGRQKQAGYGYSSWGNMG